MERSKAALPETSIVRLILIIRGHKIILDHDLAELYGVSTKALKQAVKRNIERFPEDFMFVLTNDEFKNLRSQFVTSKDRHMGRNTLYPYGFYRAGGGDAVKCTAKQARDTGYIEILQRKYGGKIP